MGYLIVFLGGGIGAALRHGINLFAARMLGTGFPYGTILINVVGSLAMGLIAEVFRAQGRVAATLAAVSDDRYSRRLHDIFCILARSCTAL